MRILILCTWAALIGLVALGGCVPKAPVSTKPRTPDQVSVQKQVKTKKPELTKIYQRESTIRAQQGTLKFTLYITESGKVERADIVSLSGNLSPALVDAMLTAIQDWRFNVKNKVIYSFQVQFSRS